MIDLHSHIIFGADDGAKCYEETKLMLQAAKKAGVSIIFATPHYNNEILNSEEFQKNAALTIRTAEECGIHLYLGSEVPISPSLLEDIYQSKNFRLHNSDYVLIEFPFFQLPFYAMDILKKLRFANFTPIIAHPERYEYCTSDYRLFGQFCEAGCLIQVDSESILGHFGRKAKCIAKYSIQEGYVAFVASDAHNPEGYSKHYLSAYKKVMKWVGVEKAELLFNGNAHKLFCS